MGIYYSELKKVPGKTIRDKLKKVGVKNIPIDITWEKAIKLFKKKVRHQMTKPSYGYKHLKKVHKKRKGRHVKRPNKRNKRKPSRGQGR